MLKLLKKYKVFFILLFIVSFWIIFFYFVSPSQFVEYLGIRNSYIILFLFASVGGLSLLTSSSFYTVAVSLVLGGVDPFILAFVGASGLIVGNTLFYYLGFRGRNVMPDKYKSKIDKFSSWLKRQKEYVIQIFIFLYAGFTPLPSDILMISLSLANYPYKKVVLPVFVGNFILLLLISYLTLQGVNLF